MLNETDVTEVLGLSVHRLVHRDSVRIRLRDDALVRDSQVLQGGGLRTDASEEFNDSQRGVHTDTFIIFPHTILRISMRWVTNP